MVHASAHIGGMSVVGVLLLPAFMRKLAEAEPQHIANTLWAVAEMGQQVPPQQVQHLVDVLVSKQQQADPQNISNTLWAVATMGQQVPAAQVQQLVDVLVSKQQQQLNPQAISNTLWAVATMGPQVPAEQVQQLDRHVLPLLSKLTAQLQAAAPQNVSNTLWACARLRYMPRELLVALDSHPQQLLEQLVAGMNTQELANSAWACGQLGHSSTRLPHVFLQQAVKLAEQGQHASFTTQELSNLCWSAAVLDLQQHAPDVLLLVQACCERWSAMAADELCQLYQVHLWLCDPQQAAAGHDGRGLSGCLTTQQLQQCRDIWEQQLPQHTAASATSGLQRSVSATSGLQRSVFAALQQLPAGTWQQPPVMEQRTSDGAYSIDIAATTGAGAAVAIDLEVDGPTHFLRPDRTVEGPTQCRNRALAARGYAVLSVPYWKWVEAETGEQQRAWLAWQLQQVDAGGQQQPQQQQQQRRQAPPLPASLPLRQRRQRLCIETQQLQRQPQPQPQQPQPQQQQQQQQPPLPQPPPPPQP